LGQRPGPGKDGKNNAKTPLLVMFPPENFKPKTNFFFYILTPRLAESVVFEQLSSSSGWRFMAKKGGANMLARGIVKGLNNVFRMMYSYL